MRLAVGIRRDRRSEPDHRRAHRGADGRSGPGRCDHRPRICRWCRRPDSAAAQEHPDTRGPAADGESVGASSDQRGLAGSGTPHILRNLAGVASRHPASADHRRAGRRIVCLEGVRPRLVECHRVGQGRNRLGDRGRPAKTASRQVRSRPTRRTEERQEVGRHPMRSTRSPTASKPPPRPGLRLSSSPAARWAMKR